jgi:CHAT domain-containing protein
LNHLHPEAEDELRQLAQLHGASEDDIWVHQKATVSQVCGADLAKYKVLAFATHGLMANELRRAIWEFSKREGTTVPDDVRDALMHEPALVLTPPGQASESDFGLLTASHIAQLKLDADYVILSCCNTACADSTPGAESLSGLARSFFYAGARSLLVSHWTVDSIASGKLTTVMHDKLTAEPALGRAEALKQAMIMLLELSDEPDLDYLAYPGCWAALTLIGEDASYLIG